MAIHYITKSRKRQAAFEHLCIVGVWVENVGYMDKADVYDAIVANHVFYAHRPPAPDALVIHRLEDGTKYIQTHPDHFKSNNLLSLPDC